MPGKNRSLLPERESKDGVTYRLASSFDHASSLGREMKDERRRLFVRENRLDAYIEKGPGAIYLAELGDQAVCPMELVRRLAVSNPDLFRSWFVAVESVTSENLSGILDRIPVGWISDAQRVFVAELVRKTREILSGMIQ